jgi:hypothetical protein
MDFFDLSQRHGTLTWSLDWAFAELRPLLPSQPQLGVQLLTAERPRLHFLAFVLAVTPGPATVDAVNDALTKPMRDVLADMGVSHIRGLRRLLGRIPHKVMERQHYQLLARLLGDASAAAVLHHVAEVSPELLDNIRALPPDMRSPVIVDAIAHIAGAAQHVLLWTDVVAARLQRQPAEVRQKLARRRFHGELRTGLEKLLDSLPALDAAPPQLIGAAIRIDPQTTHPFKSLFDIGTERALIALSGQQDFADQANIPQAIESPWPMIGSLWPAASPITNRSQTGRNVPRLLAGRDEMKHVCGTVDSRQRGRDGRTAKATRQ